MIRSNRGLATEALSDTAVLLSGTVVDDGGGGGTVTTVAAGTVIARLDTLTGSEGEIAGRVSDRSTHLVTLPAETSIDTAHRLSISGRGTFEVTAVRENTDEFARFVEVVERT